MSRRLPLNRVLLSFATLLFAGEAAALECSAQFQIQQSFANGAQWEMCFEEQQREGIVLRDINYTSPAGVKRRVLYQANIAQIHVPYDDDGARFHDVSDFGLGGLRLNDLTPADCPTGTLIQNGTKDVMCQSVHDAAALSTPNEVRYGELLALFSVSHVGAYNYVPEWRFFDDGTIEPAMGATGRLQRYTVSEDFGWPVRTGTSPVGVSHLHNYYWRLDFDLDGGDDDRFEELEFVTGPGGTRELRTTQFTTEAARSINASTQRFWRVADAGTQSGSGRAISYDIVPLETGHRDVGPTFEPWTFNDIYATNYRACERFVSHNPADTAGGCTSNGDVSSFVNGESIATNDLVLWFGLTFHHTPRDEDEAFMNTHWNRFRLSQRDWLDVGSSNSNPVVGSLSDRVNSVGDVVNFSVSATDADGDALTFTAQGLPPGLSISANGSVSGTLAASGTFTVSAAAADALASDTESFTWNVQSSDSCVGCVSFVNTQTEAYGDQDVAGNVQVQDGGSTLLVQDNTWHRTSTAFDITPNTVLAFEFASSAQGEIHGIGFDADNTLTQNQMFQLWGTQIWGLQDFANYSPSGFASYEIPVGTFYTGTGMRMVFVNDFDAGAGNISQFRNIRVYESAGNSDPGPVVGAPTNVALQGTATQVSTLAVGLDLGASKAIDGDTNGDFEAFTLSHTNLASEAWWEIDLGASYDLSRIEVFNRTDCCAESLQNFHILVSDAPFVSTSLAATQAQPGVLDLAQVAIAPTQSTIALSRRGRFVRIQLEAADYLQLAEVEIYGVPASGGNLNFAPTVQNPGAQATLLGSSVSVQVVASDLENNALFYGATGLPQGLDINSQTGLISGAPSAAGSYTVALEVSDGGSNTNLTFDWLVTSNALPVNVAPGGVASQSSTLNIPVDLSASQAIDGNRDGNFSAGSLSHSDFDSQPWWQVDLGARFTISRVDVFNREDCCASSLQDFYVLVSEQPFGNSSLAALLSNPGVTAVQVSGIGGRPSEVAVNATGRYVRVQLPSVEYLQLAEVEVLGVLAESGGPDLPPTPNPVPNQTSNLAPRSTVSQSSTLDLGLDFSADNAIDGVRGGSFPTHAIAHTDIQSEPWYEIDLGQSYDLSQIVIFNREDCCAEALRDFHVFVSDVPFTSGSVAGSLVQSGVSSSFTAGTASRETSISLNRSGRYVRIQLTSGALAPKTYKRCD